MAGLRATFALGLVVSAQGAGCQTTSFGLDASVAPDSTVDVTEDVARDVVVDARVEAAVDVVADVPAEVAADATSDVDLRPYAPCSSTLLRDLDALGARTGATTRVTGDNLSVSRLGPLGSPCAVGYSGHQVVYRYTPRATTRLRVSTNDEATDARLDTVVFVLRACEPVGDGGAGSIGCGDDTGDPPRDHASSFTTDERVTAGVPVYIVVSGFTHATHELWESQGRFALSVTEL